MMILKKFFRRFRPLFTIRTGLCFLTALLLILSFPRANVWGLCWIALIPLMIALDEQRPRKAFFLGYLTGVVFFGGTLYWFIHVTVLGAVCLILYLATYFGVFGMGYSLFAKRNSLAKLFLLPSLWVALEFIRGHLITGFGWVFLSHTQYKNLPIIQIADITGAFGVSFLIVMVNVAMKEILASWMKTRKLFTTKETFRTLVIVNGLLMVVLLYGMSRLARPFKETANLKVAIIQANIPQEVKWEPEAAPHIMEKYRILTKRAVESRPDLIIWPETAFPWYIWEIPEPFEDLKDFVAGSKTPLLFGLVTYVNEQYFNSAMLFSEKGHVIQTYNKLHLVPFGEYIPLRNVFPFLENIVGIEDFTAGKKHTLFPAIFDQGDHPEPGKKFSALICFEDTVPEISRDFVRKGANLLVNLTNDAWFQDTIAPFVHMQAALFRTIENRKILIRVTNTGVSCFIDPHGRILETVQDPAGRESYVSGFVTRDVALNTEKTFYTKYGDVFTYLCFGCILMGIIFKKKV